jgi:hypothetical protein
MIASEWESRAACLGSELDWFSTDKTEKYDARAICISECPVRKECISTALNEQHIHGIWGGVDDYEIRRTLSVDAKGEPTSRSRTPRCPYCLSRALGISNDKTKKGYHTLCTNCGLSWNMAVNPNKIKRKKNK